MYYDCIYLCWVDWLHHSWWFQQLQFDWDCGTVSQNAHLGLHGSSCSRGCRLHVDLNGRCNLHRIGSSLQLSSNGCNLCIKRTEKLSKIDTKQRKKCHQNIKEKLQNVVETEENVQFLFFLFNDGNISLFINRQKNFLFLQASLCLSFSKSVSKQMLCSLFSCTMVQYACEVILAMIKVQFWLWFKVTHSLISAEGNVT